MQLLALSARTLTFIHPVGKENKQRIIEAIIYLGESATPTKIIKHIFLLERKKIEQNHPDFSDEEKDNWAWKNAIRERTVKRWLRILIDEGIATVNKKGVYSISDKVKSDYRNFGQRFGRGALFLLMKAHGGIYTLQENTEALVNIFGTYVLYCFCEACKSYKLTDQTEDDTISSINKRISSWVQDVLNPSDMFAYFLWTMDYLLEDKEVMRYSRSRLDDRHLASGVKKKKGSYLSFTDDSLESVIQDENEFDYTIDEKIINRMIKIISKKYPGYYEPLNNARERVLFEVKHGYLNRRSGHSAPKDLS